MVDTAIKDQRTAHGFQLSCFELIVTFEHLNYGHGFFYVVNRDVA